MPSRSAGEKTDLPIGGPAFGCLSVVLFLFAVGFPLFFVLAWGGAHCSPVPQCRRSNELIFVARMAGAVMAAILLYGIVRRMADWIAELFTERHRAIGVILSLIFALAGAGLFALLAFALLA